MSRYKNRFSHKTERSVICRISACTVVLGACFVGNLNLHYACSHELNAITNSNTVQSAQKAFRDGDKQKALDLFNQAAREEPDSPQAHFGRARVLHELGRKDEAIKEYKLVLLLDPDRNILRSCREQLAYLGVKGSDLPPLSEPASAPASIKPQDVEGSISKILKQSEDKIKTIQNGNEKYASHIYNSRSDSHNRTMERAKQEIEEMQRARVRFGTGLIPAFSEYEVRLRQAELQFKSMGALDRAKSDYETRKKDAESRSLAIKESAEGLESQMINKPSETSGVFLVPEGTNLYVRNYAHFDPIVPEPPEPLLAVPMKLPQVEKQEEALKRKSSFAKKHRRTKSGAQ